MALRKHGAFVANKTHTREEIDLLKRSLDYLWDGRGGRQSDKYGPVCYAIQAVTRHWTIRWVKAKRRLCGSVRESLGESCYIGEWLRKRGYEDVYADHVRLQDYRRRWVLEMIAQREALL